MSHTIRCIPVNSSLRVATVPDSGGAQRAYPSGAGASMNLRPNRAQGLMVSAGANATIAAQLGDGETAYLEVDRGLTAILFGRNVLSLTVTSSASGLAWLFEPATLLADFWGDAKGKD